MRTTSTRALSENLAAELEKIKADGEPLTVVDADGKPQYVLSLAVDETMDATDYLLSSSENARRLNESIEQYKAGRLITVDWPE